MKIEKIKVMTVRIDEKVVADMDALLRELCLRRDDYLRSQFGNEIERLAELPPNSKIAANYLQNRLQNRGDPRVKIGLKLPENLVLRINAVCAEKRVPRDLFVESFLRFLAYGWPEKGSQSPLVMAAEYLREPYRDVEGSESQTNFYMQQCCLSEATVKIIKDIDAEYMTSTK